MNTPLHPADLQENLVFNLSSFVLPEQEIIDFALANDPQEIHTNKEIAEKSYFKGLIACGAHVYVKTHKEQWIALTKNTFICGLEINSWQFFKPVYANMLIVPVLRITELKPNSDGKTAALTWKFEFFDDKNTLLQHLHVKVLHRIA